MWYGTRASQEKSGAYLFLPSSEGAQVGPEAGSAPSHTPFSSRCDDLVSSLQLYSSEPPLVRVSRGPLFSDITTRFQHVTHRVRLYHLDGSQTRRSLPPLPSVRLTGLVCHRSACWEIPGDFQRGGHQVAGQQRARHAPCDRRCQWQPFLHRPQRFSGSIRAECLQTGSVTLAVNNLLQERLCSRARPCRCSSAGRFQNCPCRPTSTP